MGIGCDVTGVDGCFLSLGFRGRGPKDARYDRVSRIDGFARRIETMKSWTKRFVSGVAAAHELSTHVVGDIDVVDIRSLLRLP